MEKKFFIPGRLFSNSFEAFAEALEYILLGERSKMIVDRSTIFLFCSSQAAPDEPETTELRLDSARGSSEQLLEMALKLDAWAFFFPEIDFGVDKVYRDP